ncbi:hypothetical protein ONS95_007754 [Cadophora gregata]|uniref:uncharacterized protein n=1 Tax=Cadophora gregata TaxID=51156 RepID=UPI0026DB5F65|nr:uncharacterized protein ONS95_007754 [Cadophora gregata]KAK0126135.1 hypothetical protein ONS95_007754 [Cadophora gregata]
MPSEVVRVVINEMTTQCLTQGDIKVEEDDTATAFEISEAKNNGELANYAGIDEADMLDDDCDDDLEDDYDYDYDNDNDQDDAYDEDLEPNSISPKMLDTMSVRDFNNMKLAHYGETEYIQKTMVCKGVSWRHGKFPCPHNAQLSIDNAILYERVLKHKSSTTLALRLQNRCHDCCKTGNRLGRWRSLSKISADGVLLCSWAKCIEPRWDLKVRCEKHHMKHREWRPSDSKSKTSGWQDRVNNPNRRNSNQPGSSITTYQEMHDFLASRHIKLPKEFQGLKNYLTGSRDGICRYFYVDTECDRVAGLLFEIAIYRADGTLLLDTKINHNCTHCQILCKSSRKGKGFATWVYGITQKSIDTVTEGITMTELTSKLKEIGINHNSIMIEWSTNYFDFHAVTSSLEHNEEGASKFLPSKDHWIRAPIHLWQTLVPGSPSYSLELLFAKVFPDEYIGQHHTAKVDTNKLMRMVEKAIYIFE